MKHFGTISTTLLGLLGSAIAQADFSSLNCWNDLHSERNISITRRCDGSGTYDVTVNRAGSSVAEYYAAGLQCQNLPNSGAGTFVSLIHCHGRDGQRVLVTHTSTTWADRDASGNLFSRETGAEVQFIIGGKKGQEFPYDILNFIPNRCKQVN